MKKKTFLKYSYSSILFITLTGVTQISLSQQADSDDSILDFMPGIIAGAVEGDNATPPPTSGFGNMRLVRQELTQFEFGDTSANGVGAISWNDQGLVDRYELNFDFVSSSAPVSDTNIITDYSYRAPGQISTLTLNSISTSSGTQIQVSSTEQYSYASNRLVSFTQESRTVIPNLPPELIPPSSVSTTTLTYSQSGQLTGGTTTETVSGEVTNYTITYDSQGRIATHTKSTSSDSIVQAFSYNISGTRSVITTTINNAQRIVDTFSDIVNNVQTFETRIEDLATGDTQLTSRGSAFYERGRCRIFQTNDGFSLRNAVLNGRDSTINGLESFGCFAL